MLFSEKDDFFSDKTDPPRRLCRVRCHVTYTTTKCRFHCHVTFAATSPPLPRRFRRHATSVATPPPPPCRLRRHVVTAARCCFASLETAGSAQGLITKIIYIRICKFIQKLNKQIHQIILQGVKGLSTRLKL